MTDSFELTDHEIERVSSDGTPMVLFDLLEAGPRAPCDCRFCDEPALAIYEMSHGCGAVDDDRVQALCLQHTMKSTPTGDMTLLVDLSADATWSERTGEKPRFDLENLDGAELLAYVADLQART